MNERYNVLCIGVNNVPGSGWDELKYAEKNAAAVAKYFETLKDKARVTLLTGKDAAGPNIINWLEESSAVPGELNVVLFFSGYACTGKNKYKKTLERCLCIDNSELPGNRTSPETQRFRMPEILKLLENPLHRLIVIIDACCYFDPGIPTGDIFQQFKESERMTSLKQYAIISSSAVSAAAFEEPALGYGVLTYYLLKTLAGKYTFFLQKEIAFFRFLELLDKKVRTHRFTTITGRKRLHSVLRENGIMVHYSDKNFKLPVLEPIPLIPHRPGNFFQQKILQWIHFFTRTRLRSKLLLMAGIPGILLLLVYLAHISMVRIHFTPPRTVEFKNTLLAKQSFPLYKLEAENFGKKYYREFNLYLFKKKWQNALLRKLDEKGRIVLLGNLLGEPMKGIPEGQLLAFALGNSQDIFYWDPEDMMKLLTIISREYRSFDKNRKSAALTLLAQLGKSGTSTAVGLSNFKNETDQNLRNLFLEHFYSSDFLNRNSGYFNIHDYLYLVKNGKQIPPSTGRILKEKIEKYLRSVAESIPGSQPGIADQNWLEEIYRKLGILASFGSHYFKKKASAVFKKAFFPGEVLGLSWDCRNLQDKLWLLELYFRRVRRVDDPDRIWEDSVYRYIPKSNPGEKTAILKTIMDTNLELIPAKYWNNLLLELRQVDPQIVTLADWGNWLQKYPLSYQYIQYIFHWIIEKDYEKVFPFLESHYHRYFKGLFSEPVFTRLSGFNSTETIDLAKKIFAIGTDSERLHAAVFLYNRDYPEYSAFIVEFLEKARDNIYHQNLLKEFYGLINETVIRLIDANKNLQERFKYVLNHPDLFLFCKFYRTSFHFWPQQAIHRLLTSEIPKNYDEGAYFLRVCERLPGTYRKRMLIKIFNAEIYEDFRYRAEEALAKHYPGEFLASVFNRRYHWRSYTGYHAADAYQRFSYEELKNILIKSLKKKLYGKVGFICGALVKKKDKELNMKDLQYILAEFNRPLERILLREIRYYFHKRRFLEVNR